MQVNDRYEFPEELDLDVGDGKYLSADADRSKRNKYKLHSVLVHSGGTHGGHYYAFIRPDGQQWLKFEDEQVWVGPRVPYRSGFACWWVGWRVGVLIHISAN